MQPELTGVLNLIEEMPPYRRLLKDLERPDGARALVLEAAKPYFIAALYRDLRRPVLVVTAQPENARKLYEQISVWCASERVRLFPEPEALPYERIVSDSTTSLERLQALSALAGINGSEGAVVENPPLIVASAPAFAQKVMSQCEFAAAIHTITVGMEAEPFDLIRRWQVIGYRLESLVEVPGTVSHRGGIVDIYPPNSPLPARLEFFGNEIESVRLFDPESQRSKKTVPSITIGPADELLLNTGQDIEKALRQIDLSELNREMREQFEEELAMLADGSLTNGRRFYAPLFNEDSLMSYLPDDALLVIDGSDSVKSVLEDFHNKGEELFNEKVERGELPSNMPRPYFTWEEIEPSVESRKRLMLSSWGTEGDRSLHEPGYATGMACHAPTFAPVTSYAGQLPTFVRKAKEMLAQERRLVIISHQASRLSELFEEEGIIAPVRHEIREAPGKGTVALVQGSLAEGWAMNGDTCLFTDAEIFGFVKQRRLLKKHPVPRHRLFVDIKPGDYVVHVEHGIARFAAVTTMTTEAGEKEYLVLEYSAGDRLFVPTEQIDRVNRYIGASDQPPVLSRLGTQEWSRVKQKVKEAVQVIAKDLLDLYAAREVLPGFAFSPDTVWQQELEGSFPYVETPDQLTVQTQVKEDMEKSKPMDRLVCGDVGYGKTEIALRAAFKAVMGGKQVAVLVPTTVLAEQHFATFKERMAAFPIKVEVLSRFRSHKEQQMIVEGLANGSIDICIGTHRLLQKDARFKDLGLLIIDEEQRFGVVHKEYLKKIRREVDVLTLSATPIPRTLHMSLVGVRDMSVMETPPEERQPVRTYVAEYSDRLVREAIIRELERNGQVFFVHNRVQSIRYVTSKLESVVPEARFAIAHGQMAEGELEKVMSDFIHGNADVLVCTSIIESGLDMPNVNTVIINQADRFGLTQLYQLRGRVGRGVNQAYAYLLYDKGKRLTPIAEKRLRTIFEATELGAGFGIAMKDLEIRGAGMLLGVRQSGHISAVGFNLYTQLLAQAVEEIKAKQAGKPVEEVKSARLPPPTIDLPMPAYIPEDYVQDLDTRLALYQTLAKQDKVEQIDAMAQEFIDRFWALPLEVKNLLYAIRIKVLAAKAGIQSIATEEEKVVIRPFEGMRFDKKKIEPLSRLGVDATTLYIRLDPHRLGRKWQTVLEEVVSRLR